MIGHHALIGATSRVAGAASAWHPTDEAVIIEFGDATTMRDAGGSVPSDGEVVETWLSSGSVGTLTMTRQAGSPVRVVSTSGRPFMSIPALGTNGAVFTFATKDIIGTELWVLVRKTQPGVKLFLTDNSGSGGTQYQIKGGNNFLLSGSAVSWPSVLTALSQTQWVVARIQMRTDGGFQEVDGNPATRQTLVGAQAAFQVGAMGRRISSDGSDYDIASYVTVYGTADAALEANLYAWLGAERDRLNGV
jgi:hypothetical protein